MSCVSLREAMRPFYVGVDVGGTNIKLGLVDDAGRVLAQGKIPTREETGPADAVMRIDRAVRALLAEHGVSFDDVRAVGLGTPGPMDIPRGLVLELPNLPHWTRFPIRDELQRVCGKPVAFNNDANAAAFGEFWVGSGRGGDSMILLTLGTGVGGGVIVNGRLVEGVHSFGSECGHILIDSSPTARYCVWGGGQGQLEAYASASAVVARAEEQLDAGAVSSLQSRRQSEPLTALMIAEAAAAGDPFAQEIVRETARYLGIAIVTLVHVIDPGHVVLGGAMNFGGAGTPLGRQFLADVRTEFGRRCYETVLDTRIEFALLGGDAGFIGAAGLARQAVS